MPPRAFCRSRVPERSGRARTGAGVGAGVGVVRGAGVRAATANTTGASTTGASTAGGGGGVARGAGVGATAAATGCAGRCAGRRTYATLTAIRPRAISVAAGMSRARRGATRAIDAGASRVMEKCVLPGGGVRAPTAAGAGCDRGAGVTAAASSRARDGAPSALGAARPLPPAYWGTASGLSCLDTVVADVWREAYTHHIPRLMVLGNLATLLDVSPRALTDWFWVAFADAYDWVVEPNVLGMATWGAGDVMTTKPYIAGAAYLHKMGDYCAGCAFDPKRDCPVTPLYWAFLGRHAARLGHNQRMAVPLAALRKRPAAQRARDAAVFDVVAARLAAGRTVVPGDLPPAP